MTADELPIDRRSLLKKTAVAGVTAGLAAGNTAASDAESPARDVERGDAESLLESHGGELLAMLDEEDVLADGGTSELATGRSTSPEAPLRGESGTALVESGVAPARLVTVTEVDDGTLTVSVEPDTGKSYAFLDDGESTTLYNPDVGTLDADALPQTDHCSQLACLSGDGSCYASGALTYDGERVGTQASCCSYYKCSDP